MSRLLAVAPFSLADPYGGARIMRSLLRDAPLPTLAVSTFPERTTEPEGPGEALAMHLPMRRPLGRLERTRATKVLGLLDVASLSRCARRLLHVARGAGGPAPRIPATCVHAVPHTVDFAAVQKVAARLQLPMFLSLHDDPGYVLRGCAERRYALERLAEAWRSASQRFVISEEMGLEMCSRYGEQSYVIVTDGLETIAARPRPRSEGRLSVYFMGAPHISYAENFQCLLSALAQYRDRGIDAKLITRSHGLPFTVSSMNVPIDARPWASQDHVVRDFADVDLVYMPLPFGSDHADFVRLSMSTKLVTYLGSGVPLVLHGPRESAAANMLRRAHAAFVADSLDVRALAEILDFGADGGSTVAENALRLARERFLLSDVRARFWQPILDANRLIDVASQRGTTPFATVPAQKQ